LVTDIVVYDDYIGPGYGIPTPACLEAIKLVAQTEGIFLAPVYSGKAMAGLIDLIKREKIAGNETVLFLHTGGTPSLFAYSSELIGS
jgi:1-aminocyclopropane-1-carboxylate deaminase/D-cysteine desulfhydrase-like pyridoxal-dependent ACC family enzyme